MIQSRTSKTYTNQQDCITFPRPLPPTSGANPKKENFSRRGGSQISTNTHTRLMFSTFSSEIYIYDRDHVRNVRPYLLSPRCRIPSTPTPPRDAGPAPPSKTSLPAITGQRPPRPLHPSTTTTTTRITTRTPQTTPCQPSLPPSPRARRRVRPNRPRQTTSGTAQDFTSSTTTSIGTSHRPTPENEIRTRRGKRGTMSASSQNPSTPLS